MNGNTTRKWTVKVLLILVGCALTTGWIATSATAGEEGVSVFAAASTTNAITDIAAKFTANGGATVTTSFASSSTLAKQIENGAPANVFLSADLKWMDYLAEKRGIDTATRFDLLSNRIVLIAARDSATAPVNIEAGLNLAALLKDGRLAMGDPDHVPVGIYGKQALEKLGVWASVAEKIAPCKDVRAALVMVERGESPLGVVYATDAAISDKVTVVGVFPEDSHPAITYPVAIVTERRTPSAEAFLTFLKGPDAKAIFEKYGFSVK